MKMYTLPLGGSSNEPSRKIRAPLESRNAGNAPQEKEEEEESAVNGSREARVGDEGIEDVPEAMRPPSGPPTTREEALAAAAASEK